MTLARVVLPVLRVLLVVMFALSVLLQVMSVPGQFAHMAETEPDLAYLRWPLTAWGVAELLCAQVVIVGTWRLLRMVTDDRIFSRDALRWVDVVLGAMLVGWALLGFLSLFLATRMDDPGDGVALLTVDLGATAVVFLMVVMRELLHRAADMRTDLESVI